MIKSFWYQGGNVGDTLTPILVEHFTGQKVEFVDKNIEGKLLAVGSILDVLKEGDTVWGSGFISEDDILQTKDCNFMAVRGKLSERKIGQDIGVYGDPALLLPLIYNPKIEKKHKTGVVPHYVDRNNLILKKLVEEGGHHVDIEEDWKSFVDEILSCEEIISSSLHGVIIAEAYGIPARWLKVGVEVTGDGFKFADYYSGTGREVDWDDIKGKFGFLVDVPPIPHLREIQDNLVKVLVDFYK